MRRFFCHNIQGADSEAVLDDHESTHLFKTLRAAPGDIVGLLDGRGRRAEAVVEAKNRLRIVSVSDAEPPAFKLHLFFSPPRKNIMDDLVKQCAELGAWSITPVIFERSVSLPCKESSVERWAAILREGCKQSGNPFLPKMSAPVPLADALDLIRGAGMAGFFGDTSGTKDGPLNLGGVGEAAWLVGPEGGFSDNEKKTIAAAGLRPLSVAANILRIETAVVCGAACLSFAKERSF